MPLDLGWRMHSCPWLHGGLRVQWLLQWDSRSTAASVGTEKKGGGGVGCRRQGVPKTPVLRAFVKLKEQAL